jgi:hypothetical protein
MFGCKVQEADLWEAAIAVGAIELAACLFPCSIIFLAELKIPPSFPRLSLSLPRPLRPAALD